MCRGWGISLGSENGDGKPCVWSLKPENTDTFTICKGVDGTGDLYLPENIIDFVKNVRVDGKGVSMVVADGGFGRARNLHTQEEVMLRLVVAEILTALLVLAQGGRFVCHFSILICILSIVVVSRVSTVSW